MLNHQDIAPPLSTRESDDEVFRGPHLHHSFQAINATFYVFLPRGSDRYYALQVAFIEGEIVQQTLASGDLNLCCGVANLHAQYLATNHAEMNLEPGSYLDEKQVRQYFADADEAVTADKAAPTSFTVDKAWEAQIQDMSGIY